jgi:hypothetical protein
MEKIKKNDKKLNSILSELSGIQLKEIKHSNENLHIDNIGEIHIHLHISSFNYKNNVTGNYTNISGNISGENKTEGHTVNL